MKEPPANTLDFTANGVEFAPWATVVEGDDLTLVSTTFKSGSYVDYPDEGVTLTLDGEDQPYGVLEAVFLSREKRRAVRFSCQSVWAFRVLDEGGLLELWEASSRTPRPAFATFRVRGHAWQDESVLMWVHGADSEHFSWMIATNAECLEIVTCEELQVEVLSDASVTVSSSSG